MKDWSWNEVRAELVRRGLTLTALGAVNGVGPFAFPKVKYRPVARYQAIIAQAIGQRPQAVWPTRYRPSGAPIPPSEWMKSSAAGSRGHRQKSGRA